MIVALANQKGGVAKTTSTICLGGLLLESSSCLVIDLDPQANLTIGLGVEVQEGQLTTYDVMTEQADVLEAVIPTKTDKEVIHPSQFVNCPLLLLEARFLLLSP